MLLKADKIAALNWEKATKERPLLFQIRKHHKSWIARQHGPLYNGPYSLLTFLRILFVFLSENFSRGLLQAA